MSDVDVSDAGIAVMCDIARVAGLDLDDNKRGVLDQLIADGLVAQAPTRETPEGVKFTVTRKGQAVLDNRGVGVNES